MRWNNDLFPLTARNLSGLGALFMGFAACHLIGGYDDFEKAPQAGSGGMAHSNGGVGGSNSGGFAPGGSGGDNTGGLSSGGGGGGVGGIGGSGGSGGSGGTGCPLPTTDLVAHYDASTITGLGHGDSVTTWTDTVSGYDLGAPTCTSCFVPTYDTTMLGSQPSLSFNGQNMGMQATITTTEFSSDPDITVFAVVRSGDHQSERMVWRYGGELLSRPALWLQQGLPQSMKFTSFVPATFNNTAEAAGEATTAPTVWTAYKNGTDHRLFKNGEGPYSKNGSYALSLEQNDNTFVVGHALLSGNGSKFWKGVIAEIVIYKAALSNSVRYDAELCLGAKYGITISP